MRLPNFASDPIKLIKWLSVVVFVLIIFEGALRKWMLPQLSGPLFFIKDPFVLLIYAIAFKHKLFPPVSQKILFLILLFLLLGIGQSVFLGIPFIVIMVGLRSYFFLLPLVVLIAEHYVWEDIVKVLKIHLLLAIPTAVLVYLQFVSGPMAFVNKGVGTGEMEVFEIVKGVVRTYGFFSFTDGQTIYINFLFTALLFLLFLKKEFRFFNNLLLGGIVFCAFLCIAVSGSRGVLANVLILFSIVAVAALFNFNNQNALRFFSLLTGGVLILIILGSTIFSKNVANYSERFEVASRSENAVERFFEPYTNFLETFKETSISGKGIGVSSGAGARFMKGTGKKKYLLSEGEWPNILLESGYLLGLAYLILRVSIALYLIVTGFRIFFQYNEILPLVLIAGTFYLLLQGQLIRGGTPMYFCWFYVGLCLALVNVFKTSLTQQKAIQN